MPANNQNDQDAQDYQDYQDYLNYQKQSASAGPWGAAQQAYAGSPTVNTNQLKQSVVNNLPAIGGIAGGLLGEVPGAVVGGAAGKAAQNYFNGNVDSNGNPLTLSQMIIHPAVAGAEQGLGFGLGKLAAPVASKVVGAISEPAAEWLGDMANERAIEATGATGKQSMSFAPDAGSQLLKRGIVKAGNSQAQVAAKATAALDQSGQDIAKTLADLDAKGATVDQSDVINNLRQRAQQLGKDPAQFGVADSLNRMADRLQGVIESSGGNSQIPLSEAENTKRGFQYASNYNNSSPMDITTSKEAANIYRQAVEDAAQNFDPKTAKQFEDAKKTFALLNPIEEAAAKRAATVSQSPKGGLLDTTATVAGAAMGGGPGAVIAPMARRVIADRIAPTMAAAANMGSKAVGAAPAVAGSLTPAAMQGAAQFGLMASPPAPLPPPPNYSTIPGKNGH